MPGIVLCPKCHVQVKKDNLGELLCPSCNVRLCPKAHIIDGKIENFRVVEERKPQNKQGDIFDLRDIKKDDLYNVSKKDSNLKNKVTDEVNLG